MHMLYQMLLAFFFFSMVCQSKSSCQTGEIPRMKNGMRIRYRLLVEGTRDLFFGLVR